MVHFVGAGCGAADLITVRGAKLLSEADVVIYAGSLVNPELLNYCKEGCEIHNSAKMTLEETTAVIVKAEAEGKTTVRLHTGDSSIYGAVREQFDELIPRGIEYDVTPGVSAFCGAAASLKQEFTLPDVSQTVIITRQTGRTKVPEKESIRSLAAHRATMCLYLSTRLTEELQKELTYLKTVREKEVADLIKEARGFGDLSENSEYDEAKNEQGKLYSRIAEVEEILLHTVIVDENDAGTNGISIGCRVTVQDVKSGRELPEYKVVGSQEADPMHRAISEDSPFGKALMGAKEGDEVMVEAPVGAIVYRIVKIER